MEFLPELLIALSGQSRPVAELIAVDTASDDGTAEMLREAATSFYRVSVQDFQHGRTRNSAAAAATGDILVFLTQDAIPQSSGWLESLIEPILEGHAQATFGRQVARAGAPPVERYARLTNYPSEGRLISSNNATASLGIRAYFFSNTCSAVRRKVFEELGGFPTHTIMNEDMLLAAKLLKAGHSIAYVPSAVVKHSHDYTVWQVFQRYFDIGVVFEQAKEDLAGKNATKEGIRYVRGLFTWLWANGYYAWLPRAFAESAAKWVGTSLGRKHKMLPLSVVRHLSMHRDYWSDRS